MVDPVSIGVGFGGNFLSFFLQKILDKIEEEGIKTHLKVVFQEPVNNGMKDLNSLISSLYLVTGSLTLGNYLEPFDPESSADAMLDEYFKSIHNFLSSFRLLSQLFDAHLLELRQILDTEDIIAIEAIIKAFEGAHPDWQFLFQHSTFKKFVKETADKPKTFTIVLMSKFVERIESDPDLQNLRMSEEQVKMMNEIFTKGEKKNHPK